MKSSKISKGKREKGQVIRNKEQDIMDKGKEVGSRQKSKMKEAGVMSRNWVTVNSRLKPV